MLKEKQICIIDDDDICTVIMKKNISKLYPALPIASYKHGQEALDAFMKLKHDEEELSCVIFLDLNMPVLDGWEFLEIFTRLIRKTKKQVSIYVISSSISNTDKSRVSSYHEVSGYLLKPITRSMLQEVVDKELE